MTNSPAGAVRLDTICGRPSQGSPVALSRLTNRGPSAGAGCDGCGSPTRRPLIDTVGRSVTTTPPMPVGPAVTLVRAQYFIVLVVVLENPTPATEMPPPVELRPVRPGGVG